MTPEHETRWERWRRRGFWQYAFIVGSVWFWLFISLWVLLQCVNSRCAYVEAAFTTRLLYTLAAWIVGALFFGGAMWVIQEFLSRRSTRR